LVVRAVGNRNFTLTSNIFASLHLEGLGQALAKVQHPHPLLNLKIALDRTFIVGVATVECFLV
jgi:hypothetical protein